MRKVLGSFKVLVSFIVLSAAATLGAEDLTLPAAASIVGGAPFFSDVRAFNTSYTDALDVTARYRCFLTCTAVGTPEFQFTLAPRQSMAFDDMVAQTFQAPNTAGGVEFEWSGGGDQLVVTSRLFSTEPEPTVGMFIPGVRNDEAHETTVLTSIQNGGAGPSFRTNVGVFNREDSAVDVTFRIIDGGGGGQVGNDVTINVPGHSGGQVNGIFNAAGQGGHVTENAVIVVSASHSVFSYAAVIDNHTQDPIFVQGAQDEPFQATTPSGPTATPTVGAPTATPTVGAPTATPTPPPGATRVVAVGPGGSMSFRDAVSQTSTSTIQVGDTIRWEWAGGLPHTSTSGNCCTGDGIWASPTQTTGTFEHTFSAQGSFPYFCIVHGSAMTGTVIVNP